MKKPLYRTKVKTKKKQASETATNQTKEIETMRTNILMETPLVMEAQAITGIKTKTGVIHHALRELVRKSKMKDILAFQGKVDFFEGFEKEMAAR